MVWYMMCEILGFMSKSACWELLVDLVCIWDQLALMFVINLSLVCFWQLGRQLDCLDWNGMSLCRLVEWEYAHWANPTLESPLTLCCWANPKSGSSMTL